MQVPLNRKYLQPEEDGLLMRESGAWVVEKLHYIQRYINMFTTSMRNKPWRSMRYIDLFVGPGKCIVKESKQVFLGSALLALNTEYPFTDHIFVDIDFKNINALSERVKAVQNSPQIQYYTDDSNKAVHTITNQIIQEDKKRIPQKWESLNLAILDPEGLELEWQTVSALANVKRMDLIIHYSQSGLTRNLEQYHSSSQETVIDRFFGDREWRNIYDIEQKKGTTIAGIHRPLIDHYKEKLKTLGYVDIRTKDNIEPEPLVRNTKNAPLYRLLFASKHELGHKFWEEVTKKDAYGQRRLL